MMYNPSSCEAWKFTAIYKDLQLSNNMAWICWTDIKKISVNQTDRKGGGETQGGFGPTHIAPKRQPSWWNSQSVL